MITIRELERIFEKQCYNFERGFLQKFYVTFIGTASGRWYLEQELETLSSDHQEQGGALNPRHRYVLKVCEKYLESSKCSLRTRLLDLSYGAQQVQFRFSPADGVQSVFTPI